MNKTIGWIFSALSIFSGTTSVILLIIAGDWTLPLKLFFANVFVVFIMGFAILPSLIFLGPGTALIHKKKKFLGAIFIWLGSTYTGIVFAAWSAGIFMYVMNNTSSFWGAILASFWFGIFPISYYTSKTEIKNDSEKSNLEFNNFTAQFSTLIMIVYGIFTGDTSFMSIISSYIFTYAILSGFHIFWINYSNLSSIFSDDF